MSNGGRLKAAIVGLGQVGMLFDDEPERQATGEIWTHFAAYERLKSTYDLVAVADPDADRRARAEVRCPGLRTYASVDAMLAAENLDVVSVCTPDGTHLEVVEALTSRVRGIFLEKPFCAVHELHKAKEVAFAVINSDMAVRVNYYKRFEPLYLELVRRLQGQRIINVCARYSGPFYAVGCHAVNLLLDLIPDLGVIHAWCVPGPDETGYSASFGNGISSQLLCCGPRYDLIFELEVIASDGRFVLERNFSNLKAYSYRPSTRYKGYRELLQLEDLELSSNKKRFVRPLKEIGEELRGGGHSYRDLEDALRTQQIMSDIEALALRGAQSEYGAPL